MPLHKALKELDSKYYPDVAQLGNLQTAISNSLANIGSQLVATSAENFIPYARIKMGNGLHKFILSKDNDYFYLIFGMKECFLVMVLITTFQM